MSDAHEISYTNERFTVRISLTFKASNRLMIIMSSLRR